MTNHSIQPDQWIQENTIYEVLAGSHAYGLNTPESDEDYRGICIAPLEYHYGFLHRFEQKEEHKVDRVIMDIRKFFNLACACNPNIIEQLYVPDFCIKKMTKWAERILEHRDKFLSQNAANTYAGYSFSQLKRIKGHRAYLLHPPKGKPTRAEYGLPECGIIPKDWVNTLLFSNELPPVLPEVLETIEKERKYFSAMKAWDQYENWKASRNPKRAVMEAKYGYDLKHAIALKRLLSMGREIITTGKVLVYRPDREELLAIKNGAWTYEQLVEWAEKEQAFIEDFYKSGKSPLPKSPDRTFLNNLCMEIEQDFLGR